jgi:hypothetical protein
VKEEDKKRELIGGALALYPHEAVAEAAETVDGDYGGRRGGGRGVVGAGKAEVATV